MFSISRLPDQGDLIQPRKSVSSEPQLLGTGELTRVTKAVLQAQKHHSHNQVF